MTGTASGMMSTMLLLLLLLRPWLLEEATLFDERPSVLLLRCSLQGNHAPAYTRAGSY